MKRRQRIKPLKQWLDEVRPLINAPDTPPVRGKVSDMAIDRMRTVHRLLAHEYGVPGVIKAFNATSSEDPQVLEAWLKQQRRTP